MILKILNAVQSPPLNLLCPCLVEVSFSKSDMWCQFGERWLDSIIDFARLRQHHSLPIHTPIAVAFYWRLQGIVQLVKFSEFIANRGYYWVWRILLSSGRGCKKYFSVKYIFLVHVFFTDIYDHNMLIKSETYGFRLGSHQARSTEKGQLFYILHAFLIFYVPQFEFQNEKQLLV